MDSTRIKQDSSIKEAYRECTYDNGIRCLIILLGESEDSSMSSASLLASRRLTKTSHTASALPLLGHKLGGTLILSLRWLIGSWSCTGSGMLWKLLKA